jgi:hypothetical protein
LKKKANEIKEIITGAVTKNVLGGIELFDIK